MVEARQEKTKTIKSEQQQQEGAASARKRDVYIPLREGDTPIILGRENYICMPVFPVRGSE